MPKNILEIAIKLTKQGGGDKETVGALINVKNGLKELAVIGGTVATVIAGVDQFLKQTAGKFIAYATEVDKFSYALGTSAVQASRLIQVADDFGISTDTLQKALFKSVKEGMAPTIEGLAGMAEQYNALASPQEKANFLQDNFGKSSQELARLLGEGKDAILARSAAIQQGLIIDNKAVAAARAYAFALDDLNDNVDAVKISIGSKLTPALAWALDYTNRSVTGWGDFAEGLGNVISQIDLSDSIFGKLLSNYGKFFNFMTLGIPKYLFTDVQKWRDSMDKAAAETANNANELENLQDKYKSITSFAQEYTDTSVKIKDIEAQLADARKRGYSETGDTIVGLKGQLSDLQATQQRQTDQWVLNVLTQKLAVDGLSKDDMDYLIQYQVNTGLITDEAAARARSAWDYAEALAGIQDKNIYINTIYRDIYGGSIRSVAAAGGAGGPAAAALKKAAGGPLGSVSVVGEEGWEAIIKRGNDFIVIPHAMSQFLANYGLLDVENSFAFGGSHNFGAIGSGGSDTSKSGSDSSTSIKVNTTKSGTDTSSTKSSSDSSAAAAAAATESVSGAVSDSIASVVEPIAASVPVVLNETISMFQATQQANTAQVQEQTAVTAQTGADTIAAIKRMASLIERLPERLAAEIQKMR